MRGVRGFPQRHEIDYLLVGHVARDLVEGGDRPGGTVVYAGHTARQLGCRVGIVTSAAPTEDLPQALTGLAFVCRPAAATTTFVNRYTASGRTQRLLARAAPLEPCDVPPAWHSARIVHLGPLVQEIGAPWLDAYPPEPGVRLVGATLQGWLRTWDQGGNVRCAPLADPESLLRRLDVAVCSIEDLGSDWRLAEQYAAVARRLVVTTGADGATVYDAGQRTDVPGFRATEVDPTGAGDVFAAALFIRLAAGDSLTVAARYANGVASLAVEGPGITSIPTPEQVAAQVRGDGARGVG